MGAHIRAFVFSILAGAVCANLASAQHAGHHGASGGAHASGVGGVHTNAPGVRGFSPGVGGFSPGFTVPGVLPPPASGISPLAWRQIQRSNYFYYRHAPLGYFFAPYYYPFLGYADSTYASYPDLPASTDEAAAQGAMMAQNDLSRQIQRLSDEVEQLRSSQHAGTSAPEQNIEQNPPEVPVTLVLRSGQRLEVQNYAVMGQTFWDFSRQPARRIPVSAIDLEASSKATEANGGEFPRLKVSN